jgi:hypothetical protein
MIRKLFIGFLLIISLCRFLSSCKNPSRDSEISLTLIPPTEITNKIDLDIRAGIRNNGSEEKNLDISIYLNEVKESSRLFQIKLAIKPDSVNSVKYVMPTADKLGDNTIILEAKDGTLTYKKEKKIKVIESDSRSSKTIGGAWISFYHWSEQEGKMWNPAMKQMTNNQWKELVSSMHKIKMDIIVIQESFRNQEYVGKHTIEGDGYKGKAFYPSKLYPERMPIAAQDPLEAVLSEADALKMHVFMGVGMYAWFDYSEGSLAWHKKVAKELWEMYGHHESFYGFYVSEEGMGSLDCFEKDSLKQIERRKEVLHFFEEFNPFCNELAPDKPVMFAPNGWGVGRAKDLYPKLLKNVDIICPFAFARMPEGDLSGKETVNLLQKFCDDANAHLWLDLEAFLFNEKEGYLYPRPIQEITNDLSLFDNFEKVICYQYPGVFSDPQMSIQVGETEATVKLFHDYQKYLTSKRVEK